MTVHKTLAEAKAHFAECVRLAESGREVVLTRHGRPVAKLVGSGRLATSNTAGMVAEPEATYEPTPRLPADTTEAIAPERRLDAILRALEAEVWQRVPKNQRGRKPTKKERERILGYGKEGVG